MSKKRKIPLGWDFSVIKDSQVDRGDWNGMEDIWNRATILRPDENPEAFNEAVWAQPLRSPSTDLIRGITKYWNSHDEITWLGVYDVTMCCELLLWAEEGTGKIGGFSLKGDAFDTDSAVGVIHVPDADCPNHYNCWWDGAKLRDVPRVKCRLTPEDYILMNTRDN